MKRAQSNLRRGLLGAVAGLVVIATLQRPAVGQAPEDTPRATVVTEGAATLRTAAQMEEDHAANPNLNPSGIEEIPFRPTMDVGEYLAEKAAAAAAPVGQRTVPAAAPPAGPPVQGPASCNGIGQLAPITGGLFPPDTHGTVGATQFGQIVNSAIRIYSKALAANCPATIDLNVSLAAFFGYFTETLFDPRIVYDLTYNRWIVTAEAFPQGNGQQFHFVAVSTSSNGAGPYFIYAFDMNALTGGVGNFWDYPQLGYDEDAVIVTGNLFNPGFVGANVLFFPKHRMYAGLGFSFCIWGGGDLNLGTIAPPIVLDQAPTTILAVASAGSDIIRLTKWSNTSRVCPTFITTANIPATINVPPSAAQPGTAEVLDTLDARFQNAHTQSGTPAFGGTTTVWQTQTNSLGGLATPRFYKIDADANTIAQSCNYFTNGPSSHDFNPSVAANGLGKVFITWSSTDPPNGVNAQVRFTGKLDGDACVLGPGVANNTSVNPLTGNFDPNFGTQRWGDYSACAIDPSDPDNTAWCVNEKVQTGPNPTTWKSRFFNIHNP